MSVKGYTFKSRDYIGSVQPPATVLEDTVRGNDGAFKADGEPDWVREPSGLWVPKYITDDYVDISNALTNVIASNTVGTILFWYRPDDATPSFTSLLSFSDTDAIEFIELFHHSNGKLGEQTYKAGTQQHQIRTDATPFTDATWAQVGMVQNGTIATLYVNGVTPAQATFDVQNDPTTWMNDLTGLDNGFISGRKFNSGAISNLVNGRIVKVKIFNYALSAEEIDARFQSERQWFGV